MPEGRRLLFGALLAGQFYVLPDPALATITEPLVQGFGLLGTWSANCPDGAVTGLDPPLTPKLPFIDGATAVLMRQDGTIAIRFQHRSATRHWLVVEEEAESVSGYSILAATPLTPAAMKLRIMFTGGETRRTVSPIGLANTRFASQEVERGDLPPPIESEVILEKAGDRIKVRDFREPVQKYGAGHEVVYAQGGRQYQRAARAGEAGRPGEETPLQQKCR